MTDQLELPEMVKEGDRPFPSRRQFLSSAGLAEQRRHLRRRRLILSLNGILPADGKLDRESLPKVRMPNRDGFVPEPQFDPEKLFGKK
jgi:hypothetical protein